MTDMGEVVAGFVFGVLLTGWAAFSIHAVTMESILVERNMGRYNTISGEFESAVKCKSPVYDEGEK